MEIQQKIVLNILILIILFSTFTQPCSWPSYESLHPALLCTIIQILKSWQHIVNGNFNLFAPHSYSWNSIHKQRGAGCWNATREQIEKETSRWYQFCVSAPDNARIVLYNPRFRAGIIFWKTGWEEHHLHIKSNTKGAGKSFLGWQLFISIRGISSWLLLHWQAVSYSESSLVPLEFPNQQTQTIQKAAI